MGIQEIPVEVAVQIFQYLEKDSLLVLSRCCKGFHQIVKPILYSSLSQCGRTSIPLLIRTLLDRPSLGRYFKSLNVHDVDVEPETGKQLDDESLDQNHQQMMRTLIKHYTSNEVGGGSLYSIIKKCSASKMTEIWSSHLFDEPTNFEPLLAILLLLMPNLERLFIEQYDIQSALVLYVLATAGHIQRSSAYLTNSFGAFPELRAIYVDISEELGKLLPVNMMVQILAMASLQRFECDGLYGASQRYVLPWEHKISVKHLCILNCRLHPRGLVSLLSHFLKIKTFCFSYDDYDASLPQIAFPTIIRSLNHLHDCLEELTIHDSSSDEIILERPFPSLASFSKLRFLEIEGDCLNHPTFSFTSLSPALQTLTVHEADSVDMHFHLTANINNVAVLPRLKEIRIQISRWEFVPDLQKDFHDISEQYLLHGVKISFRKSHIAHLSPPDFWTLYVNNRDVNLHDS